MSHEKTAEHQINKLIELCSAPEPQVSFFGQRLLAARTLLENGMDIPPAEQYRLEGMGQLLSETFPNADKDGISFCAAVNQLLIGEVSADTKPAAPCMLAEWDTRRPAGQQFLLHITMLTAPVYPS